MLHVRHLPDFGGTLRAADVELLLSYLLAPYLRVPLLMRFFAMPGHTQALAQLELQEVLDAALFEPGLWQPDTKKVMPDTIPAPDRGCLATPAGLLFQELTHSPELLLSCLQQILDNALDLDAGRYVREGASCIIMYAVRVAVRVESFIRFLLSPDAARVRGLHFPAATGATSSIRDKLAAGADALRAKLEEHALPVLQGWYGRLRRDNVTTDACTVAAHMAFIFGGVTDAGPHATLHAP